MPRDLSTPRPEISLTLKELEPLLRRHVLCRHPQFNGWDFLDLAVYTDGSIRISGLHRDEVEPA